MATVTTRGERIQGANISAAATASTDFPIYAQSLRGADITAGGTLTSAGPQEYFEVTGATTTINFFATSNLVDGKEIVLYFSGNQTLVHNAAGPPGGTVSFSLQAGANASVLLGQTIVLRYDTTLARMKQIGGNVGAGSGITNIFAGSGISTTGGSTPTIANTGVLSVSQGLGISVTGTGANPVVTNTGVRTITAGTGISVTGTLQDRVITNTGVLSVNGGVGLTSTGGANPTLRSLICGTLQLGGAIPSMGSTLIWSWGGNAFGPTRFEYPIESFLAAGASQFTIRGFVADYVGPDCGVSITINGSIVAGSSHGIGVSSIGGTNIIGPLSVPFGSNHGMGLAFSPTASSGCLVAYTIDFY